jgi:hypothetical protein
VDAVVNGCQVTADTPPDMKVTIAAGTAVFANVSTAITTKNPTITAADATFPRVDLVSLHSDNTAVVTAGVAAANPALPALPAGNVPVAEVFVPANATTILPNNIGDRRLVVAGTPAQVGIIPQAHPTNLVDNTGGAAVGTLVLPRSDTLAHLQADVAANEASINAQINALSAALVAAKILT